MKPPPPELPQRKSSINKTPPAVCGRSARVWKSCFWWFSSICLWFLTCFFLVKSKKRSYGWLPLAMLGPFGLIILTMLSDNAPAPGDLYQQFVGKLKIYLRVAYELSFFVVVWVGAYQAMVLKRNLMIMYEAAATGTSTAQIITLTVPWESRRLRSIAQPIE